MPHATPRRNSRRDRPGVGHPLILPVSRLAGRTVSPTTMAEKLTARRESYTSECAQSCSLNGVSPTSPGLHALREELSVIDEQLSSWRQARHQAAIAHVRNPVGRREFPRRATHAEPCRRRTTSSMAIERLEVRQDELLDA